MAPLPVPLAPSLVPQREAGTLMWRRQRADENIAPEWFVVDHVVVVNGSQKHETVLPGGGKRGKDATDMTTDREREHAGLRRKGRRRQRMLEESARPIKFEHTGTRKDTPLRRSAAVA